MAGWCPVADLLSHGAVAVLAKAGTRWNMAPVFVAGTVAPDVFSRVPALTLGWVHTQVMALPPLLTFGWDVMHQPFGMLVLAYLLAQFFGSTIRRTVFLNLVGGMALHIVFDMLQYHFGAGYLLLFPFSDWAFEFGWIGSEDTVWVAPVLVAAAVWATRHQNRETSAAHNGSD